MKRTFICVVLLIGSLALADKEHENKNFTHLYQIDSCSPACSEIFLQGWAPSTTLGDVKQVHLSVLNWNWDTSCNEQKPFEVNFRIFPKTGYIYNAWYNNLGHNQYAVCDSNISTSSDELTLTSEGGLKVLLRKKAGLLELNWSDPKYLSSPVKVVLKPIE